jgi:hypothetical protein
MPAGQPFALRRGRELLLGCLAVFMLPFFAAGIGLISLGIKATQNHEANAIAPLLAGILFTGFSVSILAVVFAATRIGARAAALRAAAPDQPWLWRPEWSAKRSLSSSGRGCGSIGRRAPAGWRVCLFFWRVVDPRRLWPRRMRRWRHARIREKSDE